MEEKKKATSKRKQPLTDNIKITVLIDGKPICHQKNHD